MNTTMLYSAAALAGLIGITHSVLGEKWILVPMFAQYKIPVLRGSDRATKTILRFAWHLTSIAWWGLGSVLVIVAITQTGHAMLIARSIALTFAIHAVVTASVTRGRHYAWFIFTAIAILAWFGV